MTALRRIAKWEQLVTIPPEARELALRSLFTLALLMAAGGAAADDYKPVMCTGPLPYVGDSLYSKPVPWPSPEFALGDTLDAATRVRLDQALTKAMSHTKAGVMSAAVATTAGAWSATRGADGSPSAQSLYWASAGKAFTAVVILQLVQEGKLSLSDPLSRWVPKFPNASAITVDHLLMHTAGVFSANEDLVARKSPRYRSPDDEIKIAVRHGPMFCPGEHWRYSNTGYTMLGQIIEQLDRRPYHESVNARIMLPFKLRTLRSLAPNEQPADVAPLLPSNASEPKMVPNWGYAAGNVVGSADDMLRFWHALLTGRLLNAENTGRMYERLYPMFDKGTFYGRGAMLYVLPDPALGTRTWLGHSGGAPGIKAVVAYSPTDRAFVAVALTGDGSAEASANLLMRQLAAPR